MMAEYNGLLSCIESVLFPKNAKKYIAGLGLYATFIATVDQLLMKEAVKDADGQSTFTIDATITNATVREISHAVLWNCREFSMTKSFYRNLYIFGIAFLAFYVLVYMTGVKCNFKCNSSDLLKYISELMYRMAFVFMLISYDIDPLACLSGPSSIIYDEPEQAVKLTFVDSILTFQSAAAYISLGFSLFACVLNTFAAILYCWKFHNENSNDFEVYEIKCDKKGSVEKLEKLGNKVDKKRTVKNLNPENYITVYVYS